MCVLSVYIDTLCKQKYLYFEMLAVSDLPILCLMLQLYARYGFLSYGFVMAPLKIKIKSPSEDHWKLSSF